MLLRLLYLFQFNIACTKKASRWGCVPSAKYIAWGSDFPILLTSVRKRREHGAGSIAPCRQCLILRVFGREIGAHRGILHSCRPHRCILDGCGEDCDIDGAHHCSIPRGSGLCRIVLWRDHAGRTGRTWRRHSNRAVSCIALPSRECVARGHIQKPVV